MGYGSGAGAGYNSSNFINAVTPTGTVDSVNAAFTLPSSPAPAASLQLFKNGVLMVANTDYTLAAAAITYAAGAIPQTGDTHVCWYRI